MTTNTDLTTQTYAIQRWMSRLSPCIEPACWLALLPLIWLAFGFITWTVQDIGNLFGWLVGSSLSPIGATVAPLVFGLLTVVLFAAISKVASSARHDPRKAFSARNLVVSLIALIALAHFTSCFAFHTREGYYHGSHVRQKYKQAQEQRQAAARPSIAEANAP